MYDTNISNIGEKIKSYRKVKNMSIEELGNIIGKSKTTIVRYENNEIVLDILTAIEICNALNIHLDDLFDITTDNSTDINILTNPFNSNQLYLYYISKNGLIISSIEIIQTNHINHVLMKNAIKGNKYKQEYTGVLECSYNTAFICLTNAINNPGLDKFQIEIDLHSKESNKYYGIFLGVSDNTHRPTARKCILTDTLITSFECLSNLFEELKISNREAQDMLLTKYWDMKSNNIVDYVVNVNK